MKQVAMVSIIDSDSEYVNNKGKRPQRATRGQKRGVTNSSADDADEKVGEDDGTTTVRPKRTRVAPQRLKEEEKE